MKKLFGKNSLVLACSASLLLLVTLTFLPGIQKSFSFEEDFFVLQTGIISTNDADFAVSNNFDSKTFQNGKIFRLSGITTTGEPYYIYQKSIDDKVIFRGKILVNGIFESVIQKEAVIIPEIKSQTSSQLIMASKIPHHTYAHYPLVISIKVFDAEKNPNAVFEQDFGTLENVFVNITITNKFDKVVKTASGYTDSKGVFTDRHVVREGIDLPGEYSIRVNIADNSSSESQTFKTFFRGDYRDYVEGDN